MTVNLVARMLKAGVAVGFVTLDEAVEQYTLKVMSAMYGIPMDAIEENWDTDQGQDLQARFMKDAAKLTFSLGYRPNFDDLTTWMEEANMMAAKPQVVFIDYISMLARGKYDGGETQRVMRLIEGVKVWTNEMECVTIGLHQLNREGDDGEHPVRLKDLKHGGEEVPDVVLATYRPALDPIGNMEFEEAEALHDIKFEDWEKKRDRVERYRNSTFLQLLKNRPGVHLDFKGIELLSVGESMQMRTPSEGSDAVEDEEMDDGVGRYRGSRTRSADAVGSGRPEGGE